MNSTSSSGHKTDMKITKINKYKKQNRTSTTKHKTEHNYTLVNQVINIHKSSKRVINVKTPHENIQINENIQSTTDKYTLFIPVTEKSEEHKTIQ